MSKNVMVYTVRNPTEKTIPFKSVGNGLWPHWEYLLYCEVPDEEVEEAKALGAVFNETFKTNQ